jgi:hypothetical protein
VAFDKELPLLISVTNMKSRTIRTTQDGKYPRTKSRKAEREEGKESEMYAPLLLLYLQLQCSDLF